MGFMAAIPLIGTLLDSVFGGIDRISTTDEERLKAKQEIMQVAQPVIASVIAAQAEFDKASFALRVTEVQSGDRFVRWSRPLMGWVTFGLAAYALIVQHPLAETALWIFGLVNGLFSATRGMEKITAKWAMGNGNSK